MQNNQNIFKDMKFLFKLREYFFKVWRKGSVFLHDYVNVRNTQKPLYVCSTEFRN